MTDMPPEEFRQAAHQAVDWVADYLSAVRNYPVLPQLRPGDLVDLLPKSAPDQGEPIGDILADFEEQILPAVTHWNHPRFHAYFATSASGPGILAELLTAALNVNGMLWKASPASAELEQVTLSWLRQWLHLPEEWFGVIFDTASTSTMHALGAARAFVEADARIRGGSQNLTVYTSEQAHSSVEKGAVSIGLGQGNVRKIPVDAEFRMRPDALGQAIESDVSLGKTPCCIVPTVGTTSTSSIDAIEPAAELAERYGAWLHVDAAYGGPAAILPELRHILNGASRAHSLVVNPHKWMAVPLDLSVLYTSRPDMLRNAFSLIPEYLRTGEDERAVNFMDYGVPLGRRFRSLKLWFVLRYFGREQMMEMLRLHIALAAQLASKIEAHENFELRAPVPLSLVCFRYQGSDEANRQLLDDINASGRAFLSHTVLNGKFVLRLAIGNIRVTPADIEETWSCIQECAASLSRTA
ncbi:MAG TPA: pyridoxal-dependent decarboxylase [Bryobacteraceae bacterium]|nr:pyridoxal-dependent decarboxylase [Bryobacteraceae bacterium]